MKKLFLLIPALILSMMMNATVPSITIDGDKSDWAEVPMLSEPGAWPMLKVLPAADAQLGTNALAFMLENNTEFTEDWSKYPGTYLDKDYNLETNPYNSSWIYIGMGIDYSFTIGANPGTGWMDFPKGKSADFKVIELGVPASFLTDLGEKFGIGMYYGTGGTQEVWIPKMSGNEISPSIGYFYKTRSFTTVAGTTNITTANVYAHQCMKEVEEYVDFGLRDNGYDTARWAAFPIELTQPAVYDVTTNVTTTNGWKFEFWLVDVASNEIVAHIPAPESNVSSSKSTYTFGSLDLRDIPVGKYMLKVKNRTANSTVKLNSIDLTYAGGFTVVVPGTLGIDDAVITGGKRKDGAIEFDDATTGTAEWKVSLASPVYMNVATTIKNKWGHNITVAVYEEDGVTPVDQVSEDGNVYSSNEAGHTIELGGMYLKAGNYVVKYSNATSGSDAKLVNVAFSYGGGNVQAMPGTTNVADAWFSSNGTRADGKISYSSVSSGCWAKWNINVAAAGNYNVTVNISGQWGHNYSVEFLKEGTTTPIIVTKGATNYDNDETLYVNDLGSVILDAANYEIKVYNEVGDAALHSVKLTYIGGGLVNIPGTIALNEAIFSNRAFIDGDGLHFTDNDHLGHISEEYAKWNINVSADGVYKFTANCNTYETSYSNLTIQVLQGGVEKYTYTPQYSYTGEKEIKSPEWFLEAGNYELQLSNPANYSNGYLTSLSASMANNVLIVDEMATDMQYIIDVNGQSMKPILKRTFMANMYNTVVFPFNGVTDEELASIFGTGYELLAMTSAVLDGNTLNLNFAPVDLSQNTYGTPYLIKPTQDVVNPMFSSKTIYKSISHLTVEGTNADFIGSYVKGEVPAGENNLFVGLNNLLYFSQTATPIKGMRAWFRVKGVSNPSQAIKHARIVKQGQVITAIDLVNEQNEGTIKTIENGQLIIIKNGVRYNAMGIMIQ